MLTLADVIEGLLGRRQVESTQPIRRVVIDSREAGPGDLFVAFVGEKTDGHQYVAEAFKRGAVAALVERDVPIEALKYDLRSGSTLPSFRSLSLPVVLRVDQTLSALQQLAKWWRSRFKDLRVIGITGSVGKSSTKELTAAVLQQQFTLLKSEGNLNNEIGLPLTLLQLDSGP